MRRLLPGRLLPGCLPATRAALLLALALAAAAQAQGLEQTPGPVYVCDLPGHDHDHAAPSAGDDAAFAPLAAACPADERTARFVAEYIGFPEAARVAFEAALDVWACRIVSGQAIRIRARWEPIDGQTLGRAGPFLFRNVPGAPDREAWYPAALADVFAGRDLAPGQPDIEATFNSTMPAWHFDPAVPAPANRFDLATAVLHEVAHGLGFIGALAVEGSLGYVGAPGRTRGPYIFDRFTTDAAGTPLLDAGRYPDGSPMLADALQAAVRFDGPAVRQATGRPVPLFAPRPWSEGASYSHLDEATFAPGTPDGLMTPSLARAETIRAPGPAVCSVLADIGWTLAGECAVLVGVRPTVGRTLAVRRTGPNPARGQTAVRVTALEAQAVRAVLVDALGREVGVLAAARLGAGEALDVALDVRPLAAGVYRVVVTGDGAGAAPVQVALTVVR